jgi:DNA mismatch repair protein MutS2
VRTVATTHFGALKVFVQDEPSMANAAMEWGRSRQPDGNERLGPTYRLRLGYPGESSALEIAESAGLPGPLLDRARQRLGSDWLDLAGKLRALDEALGRAERAAQQAELDRAAAAGMRRDLAERLDRARREAAGELARARHEQERLLVTKRREIENLVRSIKERAADHESVVAAKAAVERGLAELTAADDSKGQVAGAVPEAPGGPIGPDISVWSRTFRKQGTVVEVRGSKAVVAFGQIRLEVDSADLEPVRVSDRLPESGQAVHESYRFDPHLRIIGMLRDEADEAVGRFLDDAAMAGADELWVLHGKGAGVLRRMLWDRLRRDLRVEQFGLAEPAQGGGGVTVVRLKRDQA